MIEFDVLVYDSEGKSWPVDTAGHTDVGGFARSLPEAGAVSRTANGGFVMIPRHAIMRVEVIPKVG